MKGRQKVETGRNEEGRSRIRKRKQGWTEEMRLTGEGWKEGKEEREVRGSLERGKGRAKEGKSSRDKWQGKEITCQEGAKLFFLLISTTQRNGGG